MSSLAAYHAAKNRTEEQLEFLQNLLSKNSAPTSDYDPMVTHELIRTNYTFHIRIGLASGNLYLAQYVNDVHEKTMLHNIYQPNFQNTVSASHADIPFYTHENILKAIELQEAELAQFLMAQHLTYSRDNLKKHQFIQESE